MAGLDASLLDLLGHRAAASVSGTAVLKCLALIGPCLSLLVLVGLIASKFTIDEQPGYTLSYTANLSNNIFYSGLNTCIYSRDGKCFDGAKLQCPQPIQCQAGAPDPVCMTDAEDCAKDALQKEAGHNTHSENVESNVLVAVLFLLSCCMGPCVMYKLAANQPSLVVAYDMVFEKVRDRYLLVTETVVLFIVLVMYLSRDVLSIPLMGAGRLCRDTFAISPYVS